MTTISNLDVIPEEMWKRILRGQKKRSRPLIRTDQVEWAGKHAKSCGLCAHTTMHGDPRRGWCTAQKMMVSMTFPVLCRDFKEA